MYNKYYKFGYNVLGPFVYGFCKWLRDEIAKDGNERIFFFARDGYLLMKGYEMIMPQSKAKIKYSYSYFSRNSLRRALLWNCDSYEKSLQYLSKQRLVAFSEILSYYGLKKDAVEDEISRIGISLDENFLFENLSENKKIRMFYETFKEQIISQSKKQYDMLVKYLNRIGMNGRCAIVDSGWHGTMQYYLEKILQMAAIDAKINAYYIGVYSSLPLNGFAKGYLYDNENLKLRKKIRCFFGLFENILQNTEGSTDTYKIVDDRVEPILNVYEYRNNNVIINNVREWQTGCLDFVKDAFSKNVDISRADAYFPLMKFGMFPSLKQTRLFSFLYNEKDFFIPQKALFKYKPKELILALNGSSWKTGFMKSLFKVPFPYYWIYKIISR